MAGQSRTETRGFPGPRRPPSHLQVLGDELYENLKEHIMDLRIAPCARLNIDQLARQFGVSSTPVRESLARLEAEGLLERRALYRYFATPVLSKARLTELMGVRLIIQPAVAGIAARTIGKDSLRLLHGVVQEMTRPAQTRTTAPSYRSYRIFASQDALFHDTIAMEAGNDSCGTCFLVFTPISISTASTSPMRSLLERLRRMPPSWPPCTRTTRLRPHRQCQPTSNRPYFGCFPSPATRYDTVVRPYSWTNPADEQVSKRARVTPCLHTNHCPLVTSRRLPIECQAMRHGTSRSWLRTSPVSAYLDIPASDIPRLTLPLTAR
jgi:DNA-binding FadR family transcriptional regulator